MINDIVCFIEKKLNKDRFIHSMNVVKAAKELANIYKVPLHKVEIAALLHDNAKDLTKYEIDQYIKKIFYRFK
ncbi:HD domain-containing protein [Thermobrachium celere]|uniref:HD domain-containing protein n=1 Tax=Thermobrachium celere TaxID=53422 RepID=UPI00194489A2|nr:HD domain-containing protein [Thermobrachium celere]GFR36283.1 hypothetical protein TCEA9_20950 [Thermobrachium celere]